MLTQALKCLRSTTLLPYEAKQVCYKLFNETRVFKFKPRERQDIILDATREIDLPFSNCWFESDTNVSIGSMPYIDSHMIHLRSFLVKEVAPKEYEFIGMFTSTNAQGRVVEQGIIPFIRNKYADNSVEDSHNHEIIKKYLYKLCMSTLAILLEYMNTFEIIESTRSSVYKGKHSCKIIKNVIYITEQRRCFSGRTKKNEEFQYSHRFETRGHWRKINSVKLGKDREGNYVVQGHTWVKNSIKGAKDLPFIEKTRVISELRR